jgi:IS605 OrfB family transposase
MQRAVKVSLRFVTARKRRCLDHLLRRLRKLTNRYLRHIWDQGGQLDAATLNAVPCPCLSYRQRSDCLKYALEIIASTRASAQALGKQASCPRLRRSFKFSSLTATIEPGKRSFNYVLKVSSTIPGQRLVLPFKSHKRLRYWLNQPGAKLLNGCILQGDRAVLWIKLPDQPEKDEGDRLGIDLGYNKLLVDSDGQTYGTDIKRLCEKVRRKGPGSAGKRRAQAERRDYINRAVKQLPWDRLRSLTIEELKNLKRGKRPNRSKTFRKRIAPWTYRQALQRIEHLAAENRVHLAHVDPRNTSRECPVCNWIAKENRQGEKFRCQRCPYQADADFVGAQNILARTCGHSRQSMVAESSPAGMS